jgi:hypothetical protein
MTMSIGDFARGLSGGARAYLFDVIKIGYLGEEMWKDLKYFCKSTTLPGAALEEITVNYLGMAKHYAGARRYGDWTVTILGDRDYIIYKTIRSWLRSSHDISIAKTYSRYGEPEVIYKDVTLETYKYSGDPLIKVELFNAWPKSIGDISLDYGSQEVIAFDVTFTYESHKITRL